MDGKGYPKGLVVGNLLCWYGLFEWIAKHVKKPESKLLKKWNYRKKQFGDVNRGRDCAVKSLFTADRCGWANYCGVDRECVLTARCAQGNG